MFVPEYMHDYFPLSDETITMWLKYGMFFGAAFQIMCLLACVTLEETVEPAYDDEDDIVIYTDSSDDIYDDDESSSAQSSPGRSLSRTRCNDEDCKVIEEKLKEE